MLLSWGHLAFQSIPSACLSCTSVLKISEMDIWSLWVALSCSHPEAMSLH
jgi:hypothetical protein